MQKFLINVYANAVFIARLSVTYFVITDMSLYPGLSVNSLYVLSSISVTSQLVNVAWH